MEKMLGEPLTSAKAIAEQTAVFKWFQEKAYTFPLTGTEVEAFSDWLDQSEAGTGIGVALSVWKKKMFATVVSDSRYEQQVSQLTAIAGVFAKLSVFFSLCDMTGQHAFAQQMREMKMLVLDQRVVQLARETIVTSPSKLIAYENLLRNRLGKETASLLSFIYGLDVCIAVAAVAKEKGFSYATPMQKDNVLKVKNLRHPCLKAPVGNDLELNDNQNVLFLTGANMAGKSTLMKSVGIALYLAHAGFPVAADTMEFTIREGLFSSINVPDNILLGYSHFYAEVLRVKEAATLVAEGRSLLVMFDELFKGTNVKDAYEGTLEVTRAFAAYRNSLFIVSTHIIEVGVALKPLPNIRFSYMPTILENGCPTYPYKLAEGITEDRQGMMIIRQEGILELLKKKKQGTDALPADRGKQATPLD